MVDLAWQPANLAQAQDMTPPLASTTHSAHGRWAGPGLRDQNTHGKGGAVCLDAWTCPEKDSIPRSQVKEGSTVRYKVRHFCGAL